MHISETPFQPRVPVPCPPERDVIRKLYVEATSRCNLNCTKCFRRTWIDERTGDLPLSVYRGLMDDPALADVETVFFGGMGEPMAHPDLAAMVSLAADRGKRAELVTNGSLLTEERVRGLIAAGVAKVWVSLDEIQENYAKIQRGGAFPQVRENLERLNRLRRGTGVELGLTAVIMRDNIKSLGRIRDFARLMGADDLNLSHMMPQSAEDVPRALWMFCTMTGRQAQDENEDLPLFQFREVDARRLFGDDPALASDAGLFSWKGRRLTRRRDHCRFIADGACFIRWDGDVAPCMGLLHSADTYLGAHRRRVWRHAFGNIQTRPLADIWRDEAYRAFRERVRAFNFSPCLFCGGCRETEENREDCVGSPGPTCGGCLWGQGFIVCP